MAESTEDQPTPPSDEASSMFDMSSVRGSFTDIGVPDMGISMPSMGMSSDGEATPQNDGEGAPAQSSFPEMSMPEIDMGLSSMSMPSMGMSSDGEGNAEDDRGNSVSRMFSSMTMPEMSDLGMSDAPNSKQSSFTESVSNAEHAVENAVMDAEHAVEANLGELMHMGGDMLDAAMTATHMNEENKEEEEEAQPESDATSSFLTKDQKDAVVDRYRLMTKKLNVKALNKSQFISLVKAIISADSEVEVPSRSDLEAAFKVADEDKNGVIDEREFVNLFGLIKNGGVKGMAGGFLKNFGLKSNKAKAKKQQLKKKFAAEKAVGATTV
jgi:hypothetical protein